MFSENIRNTALGVTIALSAMGLTARSQEEEQGVDSSNRAVAAETFDPAGVQFLATQSISRDVPNGALIGAQLPILDGPVAWGFSQDQAVFVVLGGVFGLAVGMVGGMAVGTYMDNRGRSAISGFLATAALGTALGAGAAYLGNSPALMVVEFDTKIAEVVDGSKAHYEQSGKTSVGPLFGQVVMIPELPIPLAVDVKDAPFMAGQNIRARVALDHEGHVVGWTASPGLRPQ
jgi:hypothetical protein